MMNEKQVKAALRQAREALKKCDSALAEELAAWDIDPPLHHVLEASNACGPAIAAIREALAEKPAQQPITGLDVYLDPSDGLKPKLYSPQPAQQQEPVAWVERDGELVWNNREAAIGRNLYISSQPSKPWVGLSTEEMKEIADRYHLKPPNVPVAFRAIEAKLKERNA